MPLTESLKKQLKQLFSPDDSLPAFRQLKCQKQVGVHDCGIFAIANAVELMTNGEIKDVVFDQSKMRNHLVSCFEAGKISAFPKYGINSPNNRDADESSCNETDWKMPRRSQRIKQINASQISASQPISLENRYTSMRGSIPDKASSTELQAITGTTAIKHDKAKTRGKSNVIENLSKVTITSMERQVLEKGLNFCPTTKSPDRLKLLDDLYFFCRKLRLKEFFHNPESVEGSTNNANGQQSPEESPEASEDGDEEERCEMKSKLGNPYFNPKKDPSHNLTSYLSAVKKDVSDLLKKPARHKSNMSNEERAALKSLEANDKIVIQNADKGGKIVLMDKKEYIAKCETDLSNTEFYEKLENDPNGEYAELVNKKAEEMKSGKLITEKEAKFITADLADPRTPIFYGLPKIHKNFKEFPPLRPIVSHVNSCTRRLSEFLDSFLKRQAQLAASYVRDTKHFLQKIEEIKKDKLPDKAILVTMDVRALYTNIDHDEGVEACVEKLENRRKKSIPSETLGSLILLSFKVKCISVWKLGLSASDGDCNGNTNGTQLRESVYGKVRGKSYHILPRLDRIQTVGMVPLY